MREIRRRFGGSGRPGGAMAGSVGPASGGRWPPGGPKRGVRRPWAELLLMARWGMALGVVGLLLGLSAASARAYQDEEAERGAAVFARRCSTCHGDRGQGLTDEWRATWPPTHQNCWKANCHGPQPYPEDGFTLPRVVPALIGPGTLRRFATAADLYAYIRARMPFHAPGSLPEADYRAVTAFLLQRHGVPADGRPFDPAAARDLPLHPTAAPEDGLRRALTDRFGPGGLGWIGGGIGVALLLGGMLRWRRRRG